MPWCGCDPNHLPTHSRGNMTGCRYNDDPKEVLIRDTEQWLRQPSNVADAVALLRKWVNLNG
jgi:hypothetical protein